MTKEHIVKSYDAELHNLKQLLIEILNLNTQQLNSLFSTISSKNRNLANEIIVNDTKINDLDKELVKLSINIFSLRNPVAQDLRFVFSSSHISRNAERIGDYTKNAAKKFLEMEYNIEPLEIKILDIIHITTDMMHHIVEAITSDNINNISNVIAKDLEVDELYHQLSNTILKEIALTPKATIALHNYLLISRYLERVGDHIVNICKHINYTITGNF